MEIALKKMKNSNTLILFAALVICSFQTTVAQTWSPAGAKWTYASSDGGSYHGVVEYTYSGDTIINSINCKKLLKIRKGEYYSIHSLFQDTLGTEITYEQNGVVYIRTNNIFDTLYNFNALIGDQWTMIRHPTQCDSTSSITVIDTGTISINSIPLKFLVVNLHFDANFPNIDYQDTIIEKIGIIGSYFLPADFCSAALDGQEGGRFQCYSDDNFNTYKSFWTSTCSFIVDIDEQKKETLINIYPNPVSDLITINIDKMFGEVNRLELYNSIGQIILLQTQLNDIDISELPDGFYFIKVTNKRGLVMNTKFLKVQN